MKFLFYNIAKIIQIITQSTMAFGDQEEKAELEAEDLFDRLKDAFKQLAKYVSLRNKYKDELCQTEKALKCSKTTAAMVRLMQRYLHASNSLVAARAAVEKAEHAALTCYKQFKKWHIKQAPQTAPAAFRSYEKVSVDAKRSPQAVRQERECIAPYPQSERDEEAQVRMATEMSFEKKQVET